MKISGRYRPDSKRWGVIATTCVSTAAVVGVLMVALSAGPAARHTGAQRRECAYLAKGIAESAIQLATSQFWRDYRVAKASVGQLGLSPDEFLDNQGLVTQARNSDYERHDYLPELGVHQDKDGAYPLAGGFVLQLEVTCRDTPNGPEVEFVSQASMGEGTPELGASRVYDSAGHSKEE